MVSIIHNDKVLPMPQSYGELKQQFGDRDIMYLDDEGDKITISNQYDLDQALIYCNKESIELLNIVVEEGDINFNKTVSSIVFSNVNESEHVVPIRNLYSNSVNISTQQQPKYDKDKWFLYFIDNVVSAVESLKFSKAIRKPILKRCYVVKDKKVNSDIKSYINKLLDEKMENMKQFIKAKYMHVNLNNPTCSAASLDISN